MIHHQLPIRRFLALPLPYAAVFGLFHICNVPSDRAVMLGLIAGTALAGIILVFRKPRVLVAMGITMVVTVLVGLLMADPCTLITPTLGPVLGFFLFRSLNTTRPIPRSRNPWRFASVEQPSGLDMRPKDG
jgi:hypothetical protein